jgi:hypothetical protein
VLCGGPPDGKQGMTLHGRPHQHGVEQQYHLFLNMRQYTLYFTRFAIELREYSTLCFRVSLPG